MSSHYISDIRVCNETPYLEMNSNRFSGVCIQSNSWMQVGQSATEDQIRVVGGKRRFIHQLHTLNRLHHHKLLQWISSVTWTQPPNQRGKFLKRVEALRRGRNVYSEAWLGAGVLSCARQCGKLTRNEKRTGFELLVLLGHGTSQLRPMPLRFAVCKCQNDWHRGGQVRAHVGFAWDYIVTHASLWHLIVSFLTQNSIPLSGTSIPKFHPTFWNLNSF